MVVSEVFLVAGLFLIQYLSKDLANEKEEDRLFKGWIAIIIFASLIGVHIAAMIVQMVN